MQHPFWCVPATTGYHRLMGDELVQRVLAVLAAFNTGDLDAARPLTTPDFTYTIRGRGPFAGTYHGIDDVVRVMSAIRAATSDTMTAEPEVVVPGGEHVMAYLRVHGSRPDGRTYDSHQAYLYRFADNLLIEGPVDPCGPARLRRVHARLTRRVAGGRSPVNATATRTRLMHPERR